MAFSEDNLNPGGSVSVGDGAPLYTYESSDNASTVETDGYFDAASDQLASTGWILAILGDENTIYKFSNTGSDVSLDQNTSLTAV